METIIFYDELTRLPLIYGSDVESIFSNVLYRSLDIHCEISLSSGKCHRTSLMEINTVSDNGFVSSGIKPCPEDLCWNTVSLVRNAVNGLHSVKAGNAQHIDKAGYAQHIDKARNAQHIDKAGNAQHIDNSMSLKS